MAVGSRVSVGSTPTVIVAGAGSQGSGGSRLCTLRNRGGVNIDIGGATVASGAGYQLDAGGDGVAVQVPDGESIYGITASGTSAVHVLAVGP